MTSVLCSFWFFYLFIHNNNNKYELKYEILVVNLGSGVQHAYNTLTRIKCGYRVTGGYSYKQPKKFCSSFCTFQIHWYPLNVQNGLCFSFSSIIIIIYYCDCLHQQRMQFQFLGSLILLRFPWVNARFVIVLYCNYCIVSVCYCISWYCISSLIVYTTDLRVHKH